MGLVKRAKAEARRLPDRRTGGRGAEGQSPPAVAGHNLSLVTQHMQKQERQSVIKHAVNKAKKARDDLVCHSVSEPSLSSVHHSAPHISSQTRSDDQQATNSQ